MSYAKAVACADAPNWWYVRKLNINSSKWTEPLIENGHPDGWPRNSML